MKSHDKDKELLDRIRTREELERRGYTRRKCTSCNGTGFVLPGDTGCGMHECMACDGRGFRWESPLMC